MNARKICFRGIWFSLVFAFLPVVSLLLGIILGFLFGCTDLNEAGPGECFGGEIVYVLTMGMWFLFFTFPIGIFLAIVCSVLYLIFSLKK